VETLLYSQLVVPVKLRQAGYTWLFPDLQAALRHELRRRSTQYD
jgi:NAD dependent epimerase/dehydratase family enzyme